MNFPNPLPQLILPRIQAAVNRLGGELWETGLPLRVEATGTSSTQCSLQEAQQKPRRTLKPHSHWGKLFDQRWCRIAFETPTGDNAWLNWADQAEATLYVDGEAFWGFNVAHDHCKLPPGLREVWLQCSCVQSAIWHPKATGLEPKGSLFQGAFLKQRNEDAWQSYHDLKCLFDVALDLRTREHPEIPEAVRGTGLQPKMISHSPALRRMLRHMDEAVDLWESKGLSAMRRYMSAVYKELKVDAAFSTAVLTGHAHVDLVWIWPERIGELKAVNVFATANRLMERYPEFRFAYSQPASYEAVRKREPGLYREVTGRISKGTWEATGAMYVESDTQMACGEALSRSFAIGQEEFRNITGRPSTLTWLPDVFGYTACLPQIMRQHGVNSFFTTKMTWNSVNHFPYSSFIWKGNDGSEILSHVIQGCGYVTNMDIKNLIHPMHGNMQADVHEEFLLPTGYGDGGGGPTETMLERARRMSGLPGLPSLKWDHPEAFFDRLSEKRKQLPTHQGECYLEYHRGTYTTHCDLKAAFRGLERALQIREAAAAASGKRPDLSHSWKRLVFSQFHDYIPGSSVWDVYKEGIPELRNLAETLLRDSETDLCQGKQTQKGLFNPHAVPVRLWTQNGEGQAVYLQLPPAQGTAVADAVLPEPAAVAVNGLQVSNDRSAFRVNRKGWITSLTLDGERIPLSAPLGQLILYPDQPTIFESWDIDRHSLNLGSVCDAAAQISRWHGGGHRQGLRISRPVGKNSRADVICFLEAGSPLLHVKVDLDWQEKKTLLKFQLPTEFAATHARFGAPFGSVLRPQQPGTQLAEAMWEVPFSRWLAVFDEGERNGMYVVTENTYGASVREGTVGISLLRSPAVTGMDNQHSAAWPKGLTRLKNLSVHSDQGAHHIQLALGRYTLDLPREAQPAMQAETLFTPPQPCNPSVTRPFLESLEGGDTLIPSWIQPVEPNTVVLRLNEVGGQRGQVNLKPAAGWTMRKVSLGNPQDGKKTAGGKISFKPYEVISIAFTTTR